MTFDPFNDFETRGYLQNVFGEKDPEIIKHLEHSAFIAGIAEAFKYLSSVRQLSYRAGFAHPAWPTLRIPFGPPG